MTARTTRPHARRLRGVGDDGGYVLPVVLGISLLALLLVGAMTTAAVHMTGSARGERAAAQARASAEAGVAEALAEMARASTRTNGSLPDSVYQCNFEVNERNHPGSRKGLEFYYVDIRYGAQLPSNAPPASSCQPRSDHLAAAVPAQGTITLVSQGLADYGRQAFFTPFTATGALTGYNTHAIDVVLTNVGSKQSPVWEVTSWRDRG